MLGLDLRVVIRGFVACVLSAGLLFGASQALQGTTVSACDFNPPTLLGSCVDDQECGEKCSFYWDEYFATCDDGCCTCIGGP